MIDAFGVEQRWPFDAVHDIAFFQQILGEISAVLAGDAGDKSDFGRGLGHKECETGDVKGEIKKRKVRREK